MTDELEPEEHSVVLMTMRHINASRKLVHAFLRADASRYDPKKGTMFERMDAALKRNRYRYYRRLGIDVNEDEFFAERTT